MKPLIIAIQAIAVFMATPCYAEKIDTAAIINAHNKWRAEAGVTDKLSYSPALAAKAQAWVNNLKRTNNCRLRHSNSNGQYGENLYWASARIWTDGRRELQHVSPATVIDKWASEKTYYDYDNNSCAGGKICGHYTQIVWRTTTKVGCAMAVCNDSQEQVWACQYQPAGNWVGNRPY